MYYVFYMVCFFSSMAVCIVCIHVCSDVVPRLPCTRTRVPLYLKYVYVTTCTLCEHTCTCSLTNRTRTYICSSFFQFRALFGHHDNSPNKIEFITSGTGEPEEMTEYMDNSQYMYGLGKRYTRM